MSMLAEPRRKQKYSINPRGDEWADDDNKLGQRMLEKFGWTKGKGLGAKEDGKREHIAVSKKNDTKGVGCTTQHADNWLSHQDDFAAVLAQLSSTHASVASRHGDTAAGTATQSDVTSLEEKSKKSKRRVHYHKFTKGKDLSRCQETDLNCILGIRANRVPPATLQKVTELTTDDSAPQAPHALTPPPSENSFGVITVTSSSSIAEYFAAKMSALKRTHSAPSNLVPGDAQPNGAELAEGRRGGAAGDGAEVALEVVASKNEGVSVVVSSDEGDSDVIFTVGGDDGSLDSKTRKRKKEKRKKKKKNDLDCQAVDDSQVLDSEPECVSMESTSDAKEKEKRRKKKKHKLDKDRSTNFAFGGSSSENVIILDDVVKESEKSEKRRKRKEQKAISEITEAASEPVECKCGKDGEQNNTAVKYESTRKQILDCDARDGSISCTDDVVMVRQDESGAESHSLRGKKRRRCDDEETEAAEKLKKKKRKKERNSETLEIDFAEVLEVEKNKKRKRKKDSDLQQDMPEGVEAKSVRGQVVFSEIMVACDELRKKKKSNSKK